MPERYTRTRRQGEREGGREREGERQTDRGRWGRKEGGERDRQTEGGGGGTEGGREQSGSEPLLLATFPFVQKGAPFLTYMHVLTRTITPLTGKTLSSRASSLLPIPAQFTTTSNFPANCFKLNISGRKSWPIVTDDHSFKHGCFPI